MKSYGDVVGGAGAAIKSPRSRRTAANTWSKLVENGRIGAPLARNEDVDEDVDGRVGAPLTRNEDVDGRVDAPRTRTGIKMDYNITNKLREVRQKNGSCNLKYTVMDK